MAESFEKSSMEPERKEPTPQIPEGAQRREDEMPEPTSEPKEVGVQSVPSQVTVPTVDNMGAQLIQTPATQSATITIPATQQQLDDWSKGSPSDSLTWFAFFWLRLIKKALHFGWRVLMRGSQLDSANASNVTP